MCACALVSHQTTAIYNFHDLLVYRSAVAVYMHVAMLRVVILAVVTFTSGCCGSAPCYDHQNVTYKSTFVPATCDTPCTATPFFSPDTSLSTYVDLIESATEAIDIFTPGKYLARTANS